jgi:spermidine dehydrogenase
MTYSDKELGMGRRITRRDFMNGVAMSIGATAIPHGLHAQAAMGATEAQNAPGYYPPVKTGMRGTHDGSYTVAHAVRDGDFWDHAGAAESTGESYDLVVVGCGMLQRGSIGRRRARMRAFCYSIRWTTLAAMRSGMSST